MANITATAKLIVAARPHVEGYRPGRGVRALTPALESDLGTRSYVTETRIGPSLSQTQIGELIRAGFGSFVTKSYVDSRDALNATRDQVDAGDADRLKAATINTNNGVAGLDDAGRVQVARVPGTSTQRWPKGFYTPSSYATATSASGTETTVFTLPVTDPGFPFRLLIAGQFDCRTGTDGDAPVVRVRIGSLSGPVMAIGTAQPGQYRYGVDGFNRTAPTLGAGWEQVYTGPGSGHAETTTRVFWVADGNSNQRIGVFRKIEDFSTTVDDYQEVFYKVASAIENPGLFGTDAHNRIYGRMNTARTDYVAFDMDTDSAALLYATGGTETTLASATGFGQVAGDEILAQFGYYAATNKRRFRLLRNGTVKIDYTDTGSATAMSTDHRGWGFGMRAGATLLSGQAKPAALDWIALSDPLSTWSNDPESYSPAVLTSTALSSQTPLVGNQTLYVTLQATSTATTYLTSLQPKLHVMAIPT